MVRQASNLRSEVNKRVMGIEKAMCRQRVGELWEVRKTVAGRGGGCGPVRTRRLITCIYNLISYRN